MTATKHEQILKYIEALDVGTKVSVRQIAKDLEVSEGTAYRAIKQAENVGLVSSIPKVATVRIEKPVKKQLEDMTLHEINLIVEGAFLAGQNHSGRIPKSFAACFTKEELIQKHVTGNTLVIVSNMPELQSLAVKKGAAILIVGGSAPSKELLHQAEETGTPVLATPYDAFETISMINKAIYERLIQQDLVRIGDIMKHDVSTLYPHDTILDWHERTLKSGHSNFPVVGSENKLLGVVTPLSVTGMSSNMPVSEVMDTEMLTAHPESLVSHISRLLVWEDCDMIPVVDEDNRLVGVVNRQDIIQALQQTQKQPQFGETVDNLTLSGFKLGDSTEDNKITIVGNVTQFMMNEANFASSGAMTMIISNASTIAARKLHRLQTVVDEMHLICINPVHQDEEISVTVELLQTDKKYCKAEVVVRSAEQLKYKAHIILKVHKK
ncbi:MAG: CBS domain-containing protein [Peptococcaceae bacterium]|nr:CBS domain-containing protein [Peptococcaceae bacterium]